MYTADSLYMRGLEVSGDLLYTAFLPPATGGVSQMNAREAFDSTASRPAVVTIDLHRGHLDPAVATLPLPADEAAALLGRVVPLLERYRQLDVPLIHMLTSYRDVSEITSNPFWRLHAESPGSPRRRIAEHNLDSGPGIEFMPGVVSPGDVVIATKKRYDCFVATELEFVLRAGGHDSVLLIGVNTNSCVLATGIAASVRDFATFFVDEGVATMMGPEIDAAGRALFEGSFGWTIAGEESLEALEARRLVAV
jgi:nicotinamidase-related amidase